MGDSLTTLVALKRISTTEGAIVEPGEEFEVDDANAKAHLNEEQEGGPSGAKPGSKAAKAAQADQAGDGEAEFASDAAAAKAAELGVDPEDCVGTGKGGAITVADVEAAAG